MAPTPAMPTVVGMDNAHGSNGVPPESITQDGSRVIKIGLVDDHAPLRAAVRALLSAESDLEVTGEADSIERTLQLLDEVRPDVLVLDLGLGDRLSLSEIRTLLERGGPRLAIVILTMHDEPGFRQGALAAGASAYLLKDSAPAELIAAIRASAPSPDGDR
jgi:DNA-binding NarL/FixJ family response regulator